MPFSHLNPFNGGKKEGKLTTRRPEPADPRCEAFLKALPKCETTREHMIVKEASDSFAKHIKELRGFVLDARETKDEQLEKQRKKFEDEEGKRTAEHDQECQTLHTEIARQARDNQRMTSDIEERHAQMIRKLEEELKLRDQSFQRERDELQSQHDRDMQKLNQTLREQAEGSRREVASMKDQYDNEIQSLEMKQRNELRKLEQEHKSEMQYQRDQVGELNNALLSRDDEVYGATTFSTSGLPQKTDAILKESFSEVIAVVDDISRLAWSTDQTVWPENTLQRLSGQHGLRRLKRAILQDLVWCVLYRYVFASPFRMFGEPGNTLEHEWARNGGKDSPLTGIEMYTWPPASAQMERWRYMTLQKCREVLTQPVLSEWDPRASLKKGYSDNIAEITKKLKTSLQDIAANDEDFLPSVTKLSKKAAKIWLDFSMHRPRVMVKLTGRGSMELSQRTAQIRRGEVVLTLIPALRRYGNSEGANLDIPVSLSEGESLALPGSR